MRFYSDLATQRDADMPCKCRPRRISHGNTSARRAFASIMTAFLGGAIFVAEVCALSVVPRFEVAVLNRKLVAAESTIEQGCDPSDPRRISLRSSNYSPACVASATAKPVALPPGRCLPTKSWRGARDHRARIFDYAAGTGPAASSSHRVGLNWKSSPKRRYSP
jgi:hypothetical protein